MPRTPLDQLYVNARDVYKKCIELQKEGSSSEYLKCLELHSKLIERFIKK